MDELDRLLAETMHSAAGRAPSDAELLSGVHGRARRYRRRRVATVLATVGAVVALGVPAAIALTVRPVTVAPPGAVPTTPAAAASPSVTESPAPGASGTPAASSARTSPATPDPVRLVAGYSAPAFPYSLPATDGMKAPVASMDGGDLVAFFEATDIRHHSDTTVTVSSRRPTFTTPATEVPRQVRGHPGTLRTVDVRPAKQLVLYWPETASRWITLATDDTYTPEQVTALAGALTPASVTVLPPFTLDLSPAGLAADTVSRSTMSFRTPAAPPGTAAFRVVLHTPRPLTDPNRTVATYRAQLTRDATGATLDVDVTDWDATLRITVAAGLAVSDADLLRFAAGVHILNRSDPAGW